MRAAENLGHFSDRVPLADRLEVCERHATRRTGADQFRLIDGPLVALRVSAGCDRRE